MYSILRCLPEAQDIHLELDAHLNKIIPPSPLWRLPRPISHFLGYRGKARPDVGNVLIAASALVGTFVGLLSVAAAARYSSWIAEHHPPVLLASLGAAAVLEYNTMLSPLAQPRNSIIGHTLAAFIGVSFAKLMLLSSSTSPEHHLAWILAPLACGTASALMTLLNCVYPPGGATAILAVADPTVRALGWYLILLVLIFSLLMLASACVVNNVLRRYPVFWWTPLECGSAYQRRRRASDIEKLSPTKQQFASDESISQPTPPLPPIVSDGLGAAAFGESIVLSSNGLLNVPHSIQLADDERLVLQGLLVKLQSHHHDGGAPTEKSWSEGSEPP